MLSSYETHETKWFTISESRLVRRVMALRKNASASASENLWRDTKITKAP
jgi:hypothetical protein